MRAGVPKTPRAACVLVAALALAGCASDDGEPPPPTMEGERGIAPPSGPFVATSAAFEDGARIPQKHSCDGDNSSPPLRVTGVPEGTVTLALVVGDPDAPSPRAPLRNFTHWVLWNAEPAANAVGFPEGDVPTGSSEGANGAGRPGWTGPCPPELSGEHRYVFTFFAVDATLDLAEGASREQLEVALEGHVVATTTLIGTYARP